MEKEHADLFPQFSNKYLHYMVNIIACVWLKLKNSDAMG